MPDSGHGRTASRLSIGFLAATLVVCAGAPASALAQTKPTPRCFQCTQTPVVLAHVDRLQVGPRGVNHGFPGSPGPVDLCNQVSSLTDANFSGGSYILEQGFAQSEMAGATYTVPAAEWPIKINLAEMIFAQQTTVNTTTQWSILFYQGNPATGTLQETFVADDVILPYIRIPAGTNGVNVQFSIDPQDPEQLIIQDNGTHQFSVAFRIDLHNNQTQNPCSVAPPASSNAFPVVDVSGLSSGANNYLYGVNCGPIGCPANGGWSSFANMFSFCRPSGDWVMRCTWSSVANCTPGVGACCLPAGTCSVLAVATCQQQGGQYQGDGISCAGANCTPQTGACCLPNGTCVAGQTSSQCTSQSGTFQGAGTSCGNCPQPSGACCFSNGNCLNFTSANCTTAGGTWLGAGSACNGSLCPVGACCLPVGTCITSVTANACSAQGGTFRGVGTTCATQCPQPTGGCCLSNSACLVLTQVDCLTIPGSSWNGAFSTCGAGACTAPCYPNCDQSTSAPLLTANDFQCFLNSFAGGTSYANCDQSTVNPVLTANDFQCFLNKYAQGCT